MDQYLVRIVDRKQAQILNFEATPGREQPVNRITQGTNESLIFGSLYTFKRVLKGYAILVRRRSFS